MKSGFILSCGCLGLMNIVGSAASLSISDEATTRTEARLLDDAWVASFAPGVLATPDVFGSAVDDDPTGTSAFSTLGGNHSLTWTVGIMDLLGPGNPNPVTTDFVALTQSGTGGAVTYTTNLQGGAPNNILPGLDGMRLNINNSWDNGAGLDGNDGLEAIHLDFSAGADPFQHLGFFVGDVESRTNGGDSTVAGLIIIDGAGNTSTHDLIYNGTVQTSTGAVTYTETSAAPSGNNPDEQWGNDTAAFLSISDPDGISEVYLFVGDDDGPDSNNTGNAESISITGIRVAAIPEPSTGLTLAFLMTGLIGLRRSRRQS